MITSFPDMFEIGLVPQRRLPERLILVHTGASRQAAAEHRHPARIAIGRGAVGPGKDRPFRGQTIDIGSLDLRMPPQRLDPRIQVIGDNKNDIWFCARHVRQIAYE